MSANRTGIFFIEPTSGSIQVNLPFRPLEVSCDFDDEFLPVIANCTNSQLDSFDFNVSEIGNNQWVITFSWNVMQHRKVRWVATRWKYQA